MIMLLNVCILIQSVAISPNSIESTLVLTADRPVYAICIYADPIH